MTSWIQEFSDVANILSKHNVYYSDELEITPGIYLDLFAYYQDVMPYKYQKARDGDPYVWLEERLQELFS